MRLPSRSSRLPLLHEWLKKRARLPRCVASMLSLTVAVPLGSHSRSTYGTPGAEGEVEIRNQDQCVAAPYVPAGLASACTLRATCRLSMPCPAAHQQGMPAARLVILRQPPLCLGVAHVLSSVVAHHQARRQRLVSKHAPPLALAPPQADGRDGGGGGGEPQAARAEAGAQRAALCQLQSRWLGSGQHGDQPLQWEWQNRLAGCGGRGAVQAEAAGGGGVAAQLHLGVSC